MREILFRGKRKDNDDWVEGYYSKHKSGKVFIKATEGDAKCSFEVDPETVGEFTGYFDADERRIWEGDVTKYQLGDLASYAVVQFKDGKFCLNWMGDLALREDLAFWCSERVIRVCGNIYDDKYKEMMSELLKEEEDIER